MAVGGRRVKARVAGGRDRALFAAFLIGWLLPAAWVGLTRERVPFIGWTLNNLYNVSCLFTEGTTGWSVHYIQARREGCAGWETLTDTDYSRLEPFGHRTRIDRVLAVSGPQPHKFLQRQRLAEFVKARTDALEPRKPPVEEVRFLYARLPVGDSLLLAPGPWRKPDPSALAPFGPHVLSTHGFDGRPPIDARGRNVPLGTRR